MLAQSIDLLLDPSDRLMHLTQTNKSLYGLFADGMLYNFVSSESSLQKQQKPLVTNATCATAHPFLDIVAVGCSSGVVYVTQQDVEPIQLEGHVSEIVLIKWLAMGRALLTGDTSGRVEVHSFDPQTMQAELVAKIIRKGRPIECFERTACTQNFYINIPQADNADKIAFIVGNIPMEIIVGFDTGDVIVLQDRTSHEVVCNLPNGLEKLFYWPENDTGAVISPAGDLITFGFESVGGRAKKVILSKSKLEYSLNNGICELGNCKIAYISTTGGQLKIIDIFTEVAQIIEIDDFIEDFDSVNSRICFIDGLGIILGVRGKSNIIIVSEKDSQSVIDRFDADAFNESYVHMIDKELQDNSRNQNALIQYNIKEVLGIEGEFPNTFIKQIQNDSSDPQSPGIYITSREFDYPSDGSAQPYIVITFKRPISCCTNQINSSLLQQSLSGEQLVSKAYLEGNFEKAKTILCQAIETGLKSAKVYNEEQSFDIGVSHNIEKMRMILTANEKEGYLLVYGQNTFSTFEINFAATPQLLETFELSPDEYEVHDVALFGRHILASVNTRFSATDPVMGKSDILKMTVNGTIAATLPVNYGGDNQQGSSLEMLEIEVVNFHLFMAANNQSLYYSEMKNFNKCIEVCKINKDYIFNTQNILKMSESEESPEISIQSSLSESFNLQSIQIESFNTTCTLESIELVNLCFQFIAFNDLLGRFVECPFCLCMQANVTELQELIGTPNNDVTPIKQSRVLDFSPHKVISAEIDCFDNVAIETEVTNDYLFLLIGFSSAIIRRYCIFERSILLFSNCAILKEIVDETSEFVEQEDDEESFMMNGINAMLIMEFLQIKTENIDRERIIMRTTDLNAEKIVTSIQGLYEPYVIPKIESYSTNGYLIQLISPGFLILERVSLKAPLLLSAQAIPSLVTKDPLSQEAKTTYTMSKFIISVENNRFNDAYQYVARFDSVEIWRTLAELCVKNGYADLLKTCISHLKNPMISLLLRSENDNTEGQEGQNLVIHSENKDEEISSLLAISLNDINTGMQIISSKPLLNAKIMEQIGLTTFNLSDSAIKQTLGFTTITRKASVYCLANRLQKLGDITGANCCYSEVFEGQNVYLSDMEAQKRKQSAKEEENEISQEFESNGPAQASLLAKKINTIPALYKAAVLCEEKAYDDNDEGILFEAAQLYNLANCKSHALKCAVECENDDLIEQIGATGNQRTALEAAAYFAKRSKDDPEAIQKALLLYSGAGYGGQAVSLCLKTGKIKELSALLEEMFVMLKTKKMPIQASRELLIRAGTTLVTLNESDYALDDYNEFVKTGILALAHGEASDEALQVIANGEVQITEEIADLLTPDDLKQQDNIDTVITIGKLLFKAELYEKAVEKFILVNDAYLALNALIKLGNVEKVVKFAEMSRDKKCFIAAGNYLQTQNFRDNGEYLEWIIEFYTKANALEYLIKFFINCANEEIDVFNDYEKAISALEEASKYIGKSIMLIEEGGSADNAENAELLAQLQKDKQVIEQNGRLIKGFLNLIDYARSNLNEADCAETLTANAKKLMGAINEFDECMVEIPHILAFMCEFHAQRGENARVLDILQKMQSQKMDLVKYVDEGLLTQYAKDLGISVQNLDVENEEQVQSGDEEEPEEDGIDIDIAM